MKTNIIILFLAWMIIWLAMNRRPKYNNIIERLDKLEKEKTEIATTVDNLYNNEETTVNALEYLAWRIWNIEDLLGLQ